LGRRLLVLLLLALLLPVLLLWARLLKVLLCLARLLLVPLLSARLLGLQLWELQRFERSAQHKDASVVYKDALLCMASNFTPRRVLQDDQSQTAVMQVQEHTYYN
jgi:hypothetical protein